MASNSRFLMCPPEYYSIDYVINPWMVGNVHQSQHDLAVQQWQELYQHLSQLATLELIQPQPQLPDMVFTANAGLVLGNEVVLSHFYHPQRQGETAYFKQWFQDQGFTLYELPPELPFEGAGDVLMDRSGGWLWAGYGDRTVLDTHAYLGAWLNVEVLSLRLMDPRFYHLDTCFCPLSGGFLLYYPAAFDAYSNRLIEERVPTSRRIIVSEADVFQFSCNAINIEQTIILNQASPILKEKLIMAGFKVIESPLSEFIKAGGAAKCLVLGLADPLPTPSQSSQSVDKQVIRLEGHLLDSGLLNQILDMVVEGGGSFDLLDVQLGKQRHSLSQIEVQISAPSHEIMTKILAQAIALGATTPPQIICDNPLERVTQDGVAPSDFYVTTIYPTEVRVNCQWVWVQQQRMDAVIVVQQTPQGAEAICRLLRELQVGDLVVVGTEGIRTRHPLKPAFPTSEFRFMGMGVSSERRVELAIERIAWDFHRIRERQGKVVVVAGPVVIHTGGGEKLAQLIRQGHVQALLGGNAIAVHDIEQALMGTSLGVDLQQGVSVRGGHRHHLQAINRVRRCGNIKKAVQQKLLTRGIMYECVTHHVPFILAGSIRDDGPLPDTQMDLLQAQADYQHLLLGADLILILASMLHAIGVGNMTPAGVKLVCVDINPAVVTKLQDRGSLESIGIVADVDLFLNLLVQKLTPLTSNGRFADDK